jgi:hypothetical protein
MADWMEYWNVRWTPLYEAVMVIDPWAFVEVANVNTWLLDPVGTEMAAGTVRLALEELSVTRVAEPTLSESATVHCPEAPGAIVAGVQVRFVREMGAARKMEAVFTMPL